MSRFLVGGEAIRFARMELLVREVSVFGGGVHYLLEGVGVGIASSGVVGEGS